MVELFGSWAGEGAETELLRLVGAVAAWPDPARRREAISECLDLLPGRPAPVRARAYRLLRHDHDRYRCFREVKDDFGGATVEIAREALESPYRDLRSRAVSVLANRLDPGERAEALLPVTEDPDAGIREQAVRACLEGLSEEERGRLGRRLLSDPVSDIREMAVDAVLSLPEEGWRAPLLAAIGEDPDLASRAVEVVARRCSAGTTESFLRGALSRIPPGWETESAETWAAAGDALSDGMVLEALRSGNPRLRSAAAEVAGERRLLEAWPLLLGLDQGSAKRALERIRDYHLGMKEYLDVRQSRERDPFAEAAALARSKEPDHRTAAAWALGALGGTNGVAILLDLVTDDDPNVRQAAMDVLRRLAGGSRSLSERKGEDGE